ncbi:MAG: thymidine phosphorylase [Verrucomicrobia bacterium]|nr:thymidine phosphorylase [Verrucomicrobiota bacterium]
MLPQWIIEKKRDGNALTEEEIRFLIEGYTKEEIPDYQMAAFAMAVYFKGMTFEEMAILTDAMMRSGDLVDTSSIKLPKADKHSTGGIGDKVSLVLAPLIACCGIAVPMVSGRGLGITGGTLDKLESIPGYRTDLSEREFVDTIDKCGCSITGQTGQLAPADKKLYALRDVTGTVPSIPLIVASIMSKKMAEGIDSLVLDVKWGKGAFMQTMEDARELAHNMVEVGVCMGKNMTALLTGMNQPLGRTAGNALEVIESIEALKGNGPADLMQVTLELCGHMLLLSKKASDIKEAKGILLSHIESGEALERFKQMVGLQGGDPASIDDISKLPRAATQEPVSSSESGYIAAVDAEKIGRACILLGAGRKRTEDAVDFAVGVSDILKIGDKVQRGDKLLTVHANDPASCSEAVAMTREAFAFSEAPVESPELINEIVTPKGS